MNIEFHIVSWKKFFYYRNLVLGHFSILLFVLDTFDLFKTADPRCLQGRKLRRNSWVTERFEAVAKCQPFQPDSVQCSNLFWELICEGLYQSDGLTGEVAEWSLRKNLRTVWTGPFHNFSLTVIWVIICWSQVVRDCCPFPAFLLSGWVSRTSGRMWRLYLARVDCPFFPFVLRNQKLFFLQSNITSEI